MVITETDGWSLRDGRQAPLSHSMIIHERAQYAIYGLMLLAPLQSSRVTIEELRSGGGFQVLEVRHPAAPVTRLYFDTMGRLAEATNSVPDPETGSPIPQRFIFSGESMAGPIRWPRRIQIEQRGAPYFELALSRLTVE